ncbi:FAD/NAD(P)-binding oxidoreductase [Desulfosarcina widdelii]|uniref:FAD/NAD(P)-binding oxidoreductase n=1 Tax=Desulfosarcina widdelii TaxID=947919 RepID=A0A5K7YXJ6_9BACT|nr:FAD-dependent oxidoreductase [Desulfosarcina widdelii]BBO72663.1 FAD/NAD(P)-binding oxidoreductase [Desulfosarcina widdelii]
MEGNVLEADVAIIGGGITGVTIARELSKYKLGVVLVERGGELCAGASKATLGHIYTGLNMVGSMILKSVVLPPGTPLTVEALHDSKALLSQWTEEGFYDWRQTWDDLDIKFKYSPLLVVAKDDDQIEDLKKYVMLGESAGGIYGDFKQLDREEIFKYEPNLNKDIKTALYAEKHIVDIFPPDLVLAIAENAVMNGCKILLNTEVVGITKQKNSQTVKTNNGSIKTRFVINAAGGWADRVSDMGGTRNWGLKYNKTQIIILDRRLNGLLNGTVRWPNRPGQIHLVQRRSDNILVECGTYDPTDDPGNTGNSREGILSGLKIAKTLLPDISEKDVISAFTGVRVFNTRYPADHLVEFLPDNALLLNVIIRLPGIIGALPMARYVTAMLEKAGLELKENDQFNPRRKRIPCIREANIEERSKYLAVRPEYGRIVCRCESVSEGEIMDSVSRGAQTLDGVKFRTRASMGRCQGNFCGAKIASILAKELKQPIEDITKKGTSSKFAGLEQ